MHIVQRVVLALVLALPFGDALAQAPSGAAGYPNRPIKIVVPFPAGGGTDILARVIAQKMSADWGQPVVVENRPGANTGIGAQAVARAAPDGYTLLAAMDVTMVMNPASGASMSYDPFKDFAPVSLLAKNSVVLLVRAEDGPKTVKELIATGKANPGKLNYGGGVTLARLAGFMFVKTAGIDAVMIPYRGSSDAVNGLLSKSVDFIVDGAATAVPLVQGGKLRALAKLNDRPLPALPDLQTLSAAGDLPHFEEIAAWTAFVAPAGTPADIVEKIQKQVERTFADPATADRIEKLGISAVSSTPAELNALQSKEVARWSKVFKENDLKF